jgi:hypothetical protein
VIVYLLSPLRFEVSLYPFAKFLEELPIDAFSNIESWIHQQAAWLNISWEATILE